GQAETENLIGFFVNTLVLRTDLSGDPSFTTLLAQVRQMALDAYAHQDLPFEQLVDALVTDRDRSRTPVFQTLFTYEADDTSGARDLGQAGAVEAAAGKAGAGPQALAGPAASVAKFDLWLALADDEAGLAGGIEYSTALFDRSTTERMAGHLEVLLAAV